MKYIPNQVLLKYIHNTEEEEEYEKKIIPRNSIEIDILMVSKRVIIMLLATNRKLPGGVVLVI